MKIFISGAKGFIGKNLTEHLTKNGNQVTAVSRTPENENELSWEQLFSGGMDANVFIHLAGKAHDLKKTSNPEEYFEVNTELTRRVFNLFLQSKAPVFIYMSSVKAAADRVDGILQEDVTQNPQTPYGQSKLQAETYILDQDIPVGKRVFILRPCMVHGPGNKGNLNLLYKFVSKGIPYPLAAFENKRSFLSIANLEYIIDGLINNDVPGGVYNIADDEPLSTNDVIHVISKAIGAKPRLWKLSPAMLKGVARVGDMIRLPLNSERLKKLTESYVVSNEKIKKALKTDRLPVSSTEGLSRTIKSFNSK